MNDGAIGHKCQNLVQRRRQLQLHPLSTPPMKPNGVGSSCRIRARQQCVQILPFFWRCSWSPWRAILSPESYLCTWHVRCWTITLQPQLCWTLTLPESSKSFLRRFPQAPPNRCCLVSQLWGQSHFIRRPRFTTSSDQLHSFGYDFTLSFPIVIDFKFPFQLHQKYNITTVWRTWLFIAYSNERWLHYQFLPHHSYRNERVK